MAPAQGHQGGPGPFHTYPQCTPSRFWPRALPRPRRPGTLVITPDILVPAATSSRRVCYRQLVPLSRTDRSRCRRPVTSMRRPAARYVGPQKRRCHRYEKMPQMGCDTRRPGCGHGAATTVPWTLCQPAEPVQPHARRRCTQPDAHVSRRDVHEIRLSASSVSICGICVSVRPHELATGILELLAQTGHALPHPGHAVADAQPSRDNCAERKGSAPRPDPLFGRPHRRWKPRLAGEISPPG
jgi:hypothetical protein